MPDQLDRLKESMKLKPYSVTMPNHLQAQGLGPLTIHACSAEEAARAVVAAMERTMCWPPVDHSAGVAASPLVAL